MPRAEPYPRIHTHLRPVEKTAFDALAKEHGLTTSRLLASMIRMAAGLPIHPGEAMSATLTELASNLRRAGVNLNQIARALNERRRVADSEVMDALAMHASVVEDTRGAYLDMLRANRSNLRAALKREVESR